MGDPTVIDIYYSMCICTKTKIKKTTTQISLFNNKQIIIIYSLFVCEWYKIIGTHERFVFKPTSAGVRVFIRKEQQQTKRKRGKGGGGGGSASKCREVRTDENQFKGFGRHTEV